MSKFLGRIYLPIGIITSIILLMSWWSGSIDPRTFWPMAYFSLLFPYLYILSLFVAFVGLAIKNHKAWILIILLIIMSTLFRKTFFNISFNERSGAGLTLLSHNIGSSIAGTQAAKWSYYQSISADILCFQEWLPNAASIRYIKDSIINHYNTTLKNDPNPWPIFTHYPILKQGDMNSSAKGNGATWADILYLKDTIRIYNVHLVSNRISGQTEDLMTNNAHLRDKGTRQRIKGVLRRYKNALLQRADQAEELKQHMKSCKYPMIIAGDFNDIPSSFVFRLLSTGMQDAWLKCGNGMAYTYAGRLPFLHIDHVLTRGNIRPVDIEINRVNYSDHYPVVVRLKRK